MEPATLRQIIADNIRAEAEHRQMALNNLADFAGVARSQLYDVLAGHKAPTTDWICKIASALDMEPWQLLRPRSPATKTGQRQ